MSADQELVLAWSGDVDALSVDDLRAAVDEAVSEAAPERLVLDLTGLGFIDSTGLGLLVHTLNLCESRGVALTLRGIPEGALRLLELTGMTALFTFES